MGLDGFAVLPDLDPTYLDTLLMELLAASLKRREGLVLDLFVGALVAEHVELLQYFGLLGIRSAGDEENFVESEGACTAYDVADVVAFADVVQEQVPPGFIFLHN